MSGFADRINQRQQTFKKGVDAEDSRRKREDAAVQLRKQVREEALQKKRVVQDAALGGASLAMDAPTSPHISIEQMQALGQAVMSDDPVAQFNATQQFRKFLSIEHSPPIQEVIAAGLVPRFVQFLKEINRTDLQFEAAWVLTNIASGTAEQTRAVVENGALPIFVELLQSPNDDVREQAMWALGNIAGDSPNYRDLVLQSGGLSPVMGILTQTDKTSMMRNGTWTLSNLCRGKPPPPLEWVSPGLTTLAGLIHSTDVEVVTDACWALSYMSDGANERINAVLHAGICPRLVDLLDHTSPLVQTPALRAVGNIVTGDDQQTAAVLRCGALPKLMNLMSHSKKTIRKEACWAISNITAGTREQIQDVINGGLFAPLIHLLTTADFDVKKEAAWALSNATAGGSPQQIAYLVENGALKSMIDVLGLPDPKIVTVALEAIEHILKCGETAQMEQGLAENPFCAMVEQFEGLVKLEALQEDPHEETYEKSIRILENYFPLEDDAEDCAAANQMGIQPMFGAQMPVGGFTFGNPMAA